MRSSRFLVLTVALILGAAMSTVPLEVAGAQAPSTAVLVPSNGATVSGTSVVLDAGASSGVTQVQFELTGGIIDRFCDRDGHRYLLRVDRGMEQHHGGRWHLHPPERGH